MSDLHIDDRLIRIIQLIQKKSFCALDYVANTIGVSTRTVRNDIKQINHDLRGIMSLENVRGKGLYVEVDNEVLLQQILHESIIKNSIQDSSQRRMAFIIDKLINGEDGNTLDEWAYSLKIGKTTLVNELKKVTVALESYNLTIRGKQNNGMHLIGSELDLRFFLLDNVYEYLYDQYPLDEDIKEELMIIASDYDLEISTQTRLMQMVIIMLDRLLNGYPLKSTHSKYEKLLNTSDYQIALQLAKAIERKLPIHIPEPEVMFMTLPIAGRRTPTNNRTMAEMKITDEIVQLLESILDEVGLEKNVIHENDIFYKDLLYHLTFMINRLMFGIRLKNPLLADVKEKYPLAYKMADIAGQVIEREFEVKVSDDELGYIAFYFGVFIAQNDVHTKRVKNVAVICGTGRGTAKLVAIQLQRVLHQNTTIDLYSETEAEQELLGKYDLIFSTVNIPFEVETPVIMISEIFDEASISRQIEKVTYLQKFKIKDSGNHHSIIRLITNEEKFFVLDSKKSYPQNVEHMVDLLVYRGYLDAGFKDRLIARAAKGSMVFDRYIALPHTANTASGKIELAIGVLQEPILHNEKEIKLIFLLGIPKQTDHDSSQLVKIYDEIMKIAAHEKVIHQLCAALTYEEAANIFEQLSRP